MLAFNHLGEYSVVESWSGYFHPTNPSGTQAIAGPPGSNVHRLIGSLRADEKRRPTFFAFYVGRGDTLFRAENEQFNQELSAAGVPHVFRLYSGGHQTALWEAHAAAWLKLALAHLATPR
jgi:enterochelin esterase-like enzyme